MKKIILFTSFLGLGISGVLAQGIYKGGAGSGYAHAASPELTLGIANTASASLLQWIYDPQDLLLLNRSGQIQDVEIFDLQGRLIHTLRLQEISSVQRFQVQIPAGTYFIRSSNTTITWVKI